MSSRWLVLVGALGCANPDAQETLDRQLRVMHEHSNQAEEPVASAPVESSPPEHATPAEAVSEPEPATVGAAEITELAKPVQPSAHHKAEIEALDEHAAHMRAQAKRHGFKDVLLGQSLSSVLDEVVESALDVAKLKVIAIELGGYDGEFAAEQVLPGGAARFTSDYCAAQFLLQKYKGSVYEGTPLGSLNIEAIRIVGVQSYATAMGGTAQAFLVEPAWQ